MVNADYNSKANLITKVLDFGQSGGEMITTKNLCWSVCSIAGRLAHSAGCVVLRLARRWYWQAWFSRALAQLAEGERRREPELAGGRGRIKVFR